ncbi:hypothetical protein KC330_g82 [Hortaea werneckii]|nr:hypothetical protein KC330_g82 [Hortaea werneckii]
MDSSQSYLPPDYLSHQDRHPQTPPYTPLRPRSRKDRATGSALHGRKRQFSRPSPSPASTTSTRSIHPAETSSPAKKAARHRTPDVVHHPTTKVAAKAESGPTDEDAISAEVGNGGTGLESENDVSPGRGPTIHSFLRIRELVEGDAGYASDLEENVIYPGGLEEAGSGSSGSGECSSDDESEGEDGGMEELERRGRVRSRSAEKDEDERLSVSDTAVDEDENHITDDSDSAASDTGGVTDRLGRLRCSNGNEEAEALFETRRRLRRLSRRMHHWQQAQESPSSPLPDAPTTAARDGINMNNKRSHSQSLGASATPAPFAAPVPPPRQEQHDNTELPPTPPFPIASAPPTSSAIFDAYNDDAPDDMVVDSDAIDDQDFPTSQRRLRRRVRGPSASSSEDDADDEQEKRQRERGIEGGGEEWRGRYMQASSSTASAGPTMKSRMSPSSAAPPFAPSPFTFKVREASYEPVVGGAGEFGGFAAAVPEPPRINQETGACDDGRKKCGPKFPGKWWISCLGGLNMFRVASSNSVQNQEPNQIHRSAPKTTRLQLLRHPLNPSASLLHHRSQETGSQGTADQNSAPMTADSPSAAGLKKAREQASSADSRVIKLTSQLSQLGFPHPILRLAELIQERFWRSKVLTPLGVVGGPRGAMCRYPIALTLLRRFFSAAKAELCGSSMNLQQVVGLFVGLGEEAEAEGGYGVDAPGAEEDGEEGLAVPAVEVAEAFAEVLELGGGDEVVVEVLHHDRGELEIAIFSGDRERQSCRMIKLPLDSSSRRSVVNNLSRLTINDKIARDDRLCRIAQGFEESWECRILDGKDSARRLPVEHDEPGQSRNPRCFVFVQKL